MTLCAKFYATNQYYDYYWRPIGYPHFLVHTTVQRLCEVQLSMTCNEGSTVSQQ